MNIRTQLIKLLGGHTDAEFAQVCKEREENSAILKPYQELAEAISIYAGSYPAWKAQMDYRKELAEQGRGLTGEHLATDHLNPNSAELVDLYLGKVVDSLDALRSKVPHAVPGHWDGFKIARDEYLQQDAS
ncbi:TPA: hypothetical protein RQO57_003574 [Aeromonas dhakensis]|uniref:hypothetical protein n=1 Tax=Aeromonas dhakensis TaxID=196024 RepID=UPI00289181CE|nr:hypothetical protein [Aeromonas dhakensis]